MSENNASSTMEVRCFTVLFLLFTIQSSCALAVEWSSTSLNWRYGSRFTQPFDGGQSNHKNIFGLTHANGYEFGTNFLSAEIELTELNDHKNENSTRDVQEVYVVYRHTHDIGKITATDLSSPMIRGYGLTTGFDWSTKREPYYSRRKKMLVIGPTLMLDVPGFLNISYLLRKESKIYSSDSSPQNSRYTYKTHPMLSVVWKIPMSENWSFAGYASVIAAKGIDEYRAKTFPEKDINLRLMYDFSSVLGAPKNSFKLGVEYQIWAGKGYFDRVPLIRGEISF